MFCKNCGREVGDNAVICPYCGVQIKEIEKKKQTCSLAVVGFILSFFFSIAGLICSIIARKKCHKENLDGEGFALAGIIISWLAIILDIVLIIAFVGFASYIVEIAPYYYY